jgi:hypothetical protein
MFTMLKGAFLSKVHNACLKKIKKPDVQTKDVQDSKGSKD